MNDDKIRKDDITIKNIVSTIKLFEEVLLIENAFEFNRSNRNIFIYYDFIQ